MCHSKPRRQPVRVPHTGDTNFAGPERLLLRLQIREENAGQIDRDQRKHGEQRREFDGRAPCSSG
jgi:hypothetical protein